MHRFLDSPEDQPAPLAWVISCICEEFKCLPSAAIREWEEQQEDWIRQIISLRAYARAKAEWDAAQGEGCEKRREELLQDPVVVQVVENEFELIQEARRPR